MGCVRVGKECGFVCLWFEEPQQVRRLRFVSKHEVSGKEASSVIDIPVSLFSFVNNVLIETTENRCVQGRIQDWVLWAQAPRKAPPPPRILSR